MFKIGCTIYQNNKINYYTTDFLSFIIILCNESLHSEYYSKNWNNAILQPLQKKTTLDLIDKKIDQWMISHIPQRWLNMASWSNWIIFCGTENSTFSASVSLQKYCSYETLLVQILNDILMAIDIEKELQKASWIFLLHLIWWTTNSTWNHGKFVLDVRVST